MSVHRDIDSDSDSNESFTRRWSRRKQEARPDTECAVEASSDSLEEKPAETARPVLTDADMPNPDTLQADSDFAAFLSPGVSEQLRSVALRRLFHLPGLHIPDGLDDYDEDFTRLLPLGETLTHDMRRMLVREAGTEEQVASSYARSPSAPESVTPDTEQPVADERGEQAANEDPEPDDEPQRPA